MSRFAIIVDFALEDGSFDRFHSCVLENAAKSVSLEAGCHRFDVLIPDGEQGRIVLYEIYEDAKAFEAHSRTPHFQQFNADTRGLVRERSLSRFVLGEGI